MPFAMYSASLGVMMGCIVAKTFGLLNKMPCRVETIEKADLKTSALWPHSEGKPKF
jgi:hypothetical protein